ncbi:MFS general substrate transporter [Karstenula rhodostoma CBS 690.94]|uniref:MFS general substrate transporter n=1 Tax=Karstenula rhodostoma CBS 690.94 TaxID=1392251 RepID=A0A9P4P7D9_9PLEO|nr:MFS general substrate transporter [Karstenula rhodostoma CBS 690.94]
MTCLDTPPRGMSETKDEVKEEYADVIESDKTERMKDTKRSEEDEKHHGDFATVSSAASSMHEGQSEDHDPEAITTVPSNSPPYSVFSKKQKYFIVCLAAWGGFFSPLSANIYFPALTKLVVEYNVSSTLMNLTLTSYLIFQGLAPTFFGDFADMAGRRPAYIIGFIIYIGANIGLALQNSYAALFVLRCIQSTGSSATIALGNGVVADIATSSERGTWMGYVTSGPMVAPAIAPIIGGLLSEFLGWRAIFWFLVIMAGVYMLPLILFFPETGRNVVGNGSIPPQSFNMSLLNYLQARKARKAYGENELTRAVSRDEQQALARKRKLRIPNPLGTLKVIGQKDAGLLLFYNSLVYTAFYTVISSAPYLFEEIYGFNDLQIGLSFIPFGVGAMIAPMTAGKLLDWNYRRLAKKTGLRIDKKRGEDLRDFPLERARLHIAFPMLVIGTLVILCYGWVLQVEPSLAAPLVLHFFLGLCLTGAFNCMSVMLVDYYPLSSATATAANNLVRCFMGAGGTAVITMMIDAMGRGWCFTFIAGVITFFSPILWVLMKWGPKWREERRLKIESQANAGG